MSIKYQRLTIPVPNPAFWNAEPWQLGCYVKGYERGINLKRWQRMFEKLPNSITDIVEGVPVMLISVAADPMISTAIGIECDADDVGEGEVGAMFSMANDNQSAGIVIPIESIHMKQFEGTLRHEMVHYDQWLRGDLSMKEGCIVWKGETYEPILHDESATFEDIIIREIRDLPWEREAYCDDPFTHDLDTPAFIDELCEIYDRDPSWYYGRLTGAGSDISNIAKRTADACNVMDKAIYDIAGFDDPNAHIPNLLSAAYGHPSQPVHIDTNGVKRFKPNKIISDLCDAGKLDLNHIAATYSDEDKCQFNQLIGYSVDSWWYLTSTNMVAKSKARIEEMRHEQNSVLDGEINYIRKGDDITPMIGINVTLEGDMYDIPLALPILLQRMNNYDGHYNLRRNDSADDGYDVEWVDSSFHGHCSYDLDTSTSNDGIPEFPVHDINMKIYKDFIWLEEIADPSSGNKVLTFDWKAMTAAFLPTDGSEVNLGISKLLTRYFTYTKDNVDLQGVYMLSQSALRFYDARERILKLLDDPAFNAGLYLDVDFTGLVEAMLIGPIKNNTAVNQMLMVKKTKGAAKQIQSLLNQMNQSMVIFESGKIHLETDHAKYDADLGELEKLIKQYL